MQSISVKVNDSVQTIAEARVITKDGQPTIIKANRNANYELINDATGRGPDHIVTKRVGKDLHVSFEENAEESDLIIENFYDYDKSALIGQAESGQYHYYVPDTGLTQDYVTELVIGDIEGQALGGQGYPAPWWIGAEEGSRFGIMPWLVGIAGLAGIIAAVSDSDDDKGGNTNTAVEVEDKPLSISNLESNTTAQGAAQALSFTITSDGTKVPEADISINGTILKDADGKTVQSDSEGKVTITAELLALNGITLGGLSDFTIGANKDTYKDATATLYNPQVVTMDGGVVVTPHDTATKLEVSYTKPGETEPTTVIFTHEDTNGDGVPDAWVDAKKDDSITIDPATGKVVVPVAEIGSNTVVTAKQTTDVGTTNNSDDVGDIPSAKPAVDAIKTGDDAGDVVVTPSDDATDGSAVVVKYTDKDGNNKQVTITKDQDGWTADGDLPDGVILDKDNGTVTIPSDNVTDGSYVTAFQTDPGRKESDPVSDKAKINVPKPEITVNDDGSVTVTPSDKADKVVINYIDEDGNNKTATITKDDNGNWTSDDDNVVINNAGTITLPDDKVKDGSEVSANQAVGNKDSDKGTVTTQDNVPQPEIAANNDGSVIVTPSDDADKVVINYIDEDGKPNTATITKDDNGNWTSDDDNVVINNAGTITLPADKVKDGSTATAEQTVDGKDSDKVPVVANNDNNTTPAKPALPEITANNDGSVTVTPSDKVDKVVINYIDEDGKPNTATITKDDNGKWTSDDNNIIVNPTTGKTTIPADKVKDGSTVTAQQTTPVGTSDPAEVITKDGIAEPDVTANNDGSVTVKPADDATEVEISYVDEDGKEQTVTVTKDKDGNWTADDDNVVINDDGTITLPADKVKDGSDVTANQTTDNGKSGDASDTAGDARADAPTVTPSQTDGSVTVTPGTDNAKMVVTYTDEDGKEQTVNINKDADGNWTAEGTLPEGVTVDKDGKVTIPQDAVKDGNTVTAAAQNTTGGKAQDQANANKDTANTAIDSDNTAFTNPEDGNIAEGDSVRATIGLVNNNGGEVDFKVTFEDGDSSPAGDIANHDDFDYDGIKFTDDNGKEITGISYDRESGKITVPTGVDKFNVDLPIKGNDGVEADQKATIVVGSGDDAKTADITIVDDSKAAGQGNQVAITAISDDTGVAGDFITNDTTLAVSGTLDKALPDDEKVVVTLNGQTVDAVVDASGKWTAEFMNNALPEGTHPIKAQIVSKDNTKTAGPSAEQNVVIDTTAPAKPTAEVSDKGDKVTGTTEPNATVTIKDKDGKTIGTGVADDEGNYTVDLDKPLTNGESVTVTAKDESDNESTPTTANASDTTAPTLVGTPNIPETGDKIELNFSEPLDTTKPPVADNFTVTVDGQPVKPVVSVEGNKVTLTLPKPVTQGQDVKVAYTDPTAGNDDNAIQDVTGNDAANIPQTAATNNSNVPAPDTTAPTLVGTPNIPETGDKIELNFSEPLDTTKPPVADNFTVTVDGQPVKPVVSVEGNKVTLTLPKPVTQGQDVKVAYTDPTAGNDDNAIQDVTGNDAANIPQTAATNNSNVPAPDTTAPTLVGTPNIPETGDKIELNFSEPLDTTKPPVADNFTVTVDGQPVKPVVSVEGNKVTLTLPKPVTQGQDVKVAYTDPTAGNDDNAIQDVTGNDAANIPQTAATNNSNVPAPDTTAPTLVGTPNIPETGDKIELNFSEPLDTTKPPVADNFTVTVDGQPVKPVVSVEGNKVTLTLPKPVTQGQDVKVAYTDPTAGNDDNAIQDVTGNDAANIPQTAATNNSNVPAPDTTAPTLVGTPNIPETGDKIELNFSEPLDTTKPPVADNFTVTVDGQPVKPVVSVEGNKVTLTLPKPVTQGQDVKVAYTDPTAGNDDNAIQDVTGNDAANIPQTAATNNSNVPAPDTTAPTLVGTPNIPETGDKIELNFSEPLDTTKPPVADNFTVTVDGQPVKPVVSVEGNKVTLTLPKPVTQGQDVKVAYTDPTAGNDDNAIQDVTGNDAANIPQTAATNNSNVPAPDTTAPTLVGTPNIPETGDKIELNFSEPLDTTKPPVADNFTVTVDGQPVKPVVSVEGNKVTLTLPKPVTQGQDVKVAYTDPTAGNDDNAIQDVTGNDAANIPQTAATNNSNVPAPDTTAPTLVGTPNIPETGDKIELNFSEPLDTTKPPVADNFTVTVDGQPVKPVVSVEGNKVTLTLPKPVTQGQDVKVAYTDPTAGNDDNAIQDVTGNDAANIPQTAATNNSNVPAPDTTAPTLVGTPNIPETGDKIELNFSEPLDTTKPPVADNFTVTVDGQPVKPVVSVEGNKVTLTLPKPVTQGQDVKVAYTDPTAGNDDNAIQDVTGNDAANIPQTAATNNSNVPAPDTTAPTLVGTPNIPETGDKIELNFSEPLDTTKPPVADNFTVTVDGQPVKPVVSVEGNKVTLTLPKPVTQGQDVKVAYTDPTAGNDDNAIQDVTGNDAANIPQTAATNNSNVPAPDTTAPTLVGTPNIPETGDKIELNFSEPLDTTKPPVADNFTVTVDGQPVKPVVSVEGNKVTLTLPKPVTQGQDVKVAYTDPTAGNDDNAIQDVTGNDAANIPQTAATNNSNVPAPDTTAPTLVGTPNIPETGDKIELNFSEPLDTTKPPVADNFTVTVDGQPVKPVVSVEGNKVTLTLPKPVTQGQDVKVAYTDPTAGNDDNAIQDVTGNDAANIPQTAATNNSNVPAPDTTAPTLVGTPNIPETGDKIELNFSEPLDTTKPPVADNFTVTVDGQPVKPVVSVEGNKVTLTLPKPVTQGQDVKVAYTDPTAGNDDNAIQDVTGNDAANIPQTAATNNSNVPAPDTTAPTLVGTPNIPETGDKIELNFSEPLDTTKPPVADNFTVTVDGQPVKPVVSVEGNKVTLTLPKPVTQGQDVKVAYTDPTAGNDDNAIQDVTGNDAANIPQTAATNNSNVPAPVATITVQPATGTGQPQVTDPQNAKAVLFESALPEGSKTQGGVKEVTGLLNIDNLKAGETVQLIAPQANNITSGGVPITWEQSPDKMTLTAKAGDKEIAVVKVVNEGGTYKYQVELKGAIDHKDQDGNGEALLAKPKVQVVRDTQVVAESDLTIRVVDDKPVANEGNPQTKDINLAESVPPSAGVNAASFGYNQDSLDASRSLIRDGNKVSWGNGIRGPASLELSNPEKVSVTDANLGFNFGSITHANNPTSVKSTTFPNDGLKVDVSFTVNIDGKNETEVNSFITLYVAEVAGFADDMLIIKNRTDTIEIGGEQYRLVIGGSEADSLTLEQVQQNMQRVSRGIRPNVDVTGADGSVTAINTQEGEINRLALKAKLVPVSAGAIALFEGKALTGKADVSADGATKGIWSFVDGTNGYTAEKTADNTFSIKKGQEVMGTFTGQADGQYQFKPVKGANDKVAGGDALNFKFNYGDKDGDSAAVNVKFNLLNNKPAGGFENPDLHADADVQADADVNADLPVIDLSNGAIDLQHVTMDNFGDLLATTNYVGDGQSLYIKGDVGDTVTLGSVLQSGETSQTDISGTWTKGGTEQQEGTTYNIWSNNDVKLYIDQDITIL
ncbi:SwmB domain-containing protein [Moraxella bovis]|uniref:SwmB domain-containing protein n=1 Tax=Moraxella bovis TaxID=476 RepID=UPI00222666A7|nr:SwmB domain-containing protein [Moraxella bovis]UZA62533.1 Ig-like domain-containing protein [Moraxella bovis]